jgi:hypothetical protein
VTRPSETTPTTLNFCDVSARVNSRPMTSSPGQIVRAEGQCQRTGDRNGVEAIVAEAAPGVSEVIEEFVHAGLDGAARAS